MLKEFSTSFGFCVKTILFDNQVNSISITAPREIYDENAFFCTTKTSSNSNQATKHYFARKKVKSPHKSFWLVLFQFGEAFGTMLCKILSQGGDQILEILIGKDPINPIHSIHAHNYQGTLPTTYHLKKSNHRIKIIVVLR